MIISPISNLHISTTDPQQKVAFQQWLEETGMADTLTASRLGVSCVRVVETMYDQLLPLPFWNVCVHSRHTTNGTHRNTVLEDVYIDRERLLRDESALERLARPLKLAFGACCALSALQSLGDTSFNRHTDRASDPALLKREMEKLKQDKLRLEVCPSLLLRVPTDSFPQRKIDDLQSEIRALKQCIPPQQLDKIQQQLQQANASTAAASTSQNVTAARN
jgi:hypothetical protein